MAQPMALLASTPGQPKVRLPRYAFFQWLAVVLASFIGLVLALGSHELFGHKFKTGEIAQKDYIAAKRTRVIDEIQTKRARDIAKQNIMPVLIKDQELDLNVLRTLRHRLYIITTLHSQKILPLPTFWGLKTKEQYEIFSCSQAQWINSKSNLAETISHNLPSSKASDIIDELDRRRALFYRLVGNNPDLVRNCLVLSLSVSESNWTELEKTIEATTARMLRLVPVLPGSNKNLLTELTLQFLPATVTGATREASANLIVGCLRPTMIIDTESTRKKANNAAERVEPIYKEIESGQIIVARGEILSENDLATLKEMKISQGTNWPVIASICIALLAAYGFLGIFLFTVSPKHLFSPTSIGLMSTVAVTTCAIAAFAGSDYPQFVPLPAAALVLTIFFGARISSAITVLILIFLGTNHVIDTGNLAALATASSAAVGIHVRRREDLMFRGFLIGFVQAAAYMCYLALTQSSTSATQLGQDLALELLGGLSSTIVAIGSLPFLETLFAMITPLKLIELADSNQPLLRQLEERAPGTYQHSLAVANLSEAGARAIGADANLVHAGAMFHDIGKMVRPRYFIENQLGDKNPHDEMSPEESRDRVLAHVTEGITLAHKYGIPQAIMDFIPQHQGTTLMAYFYHKACVRDGHANVDASFYRYPGPKPQSREAAIVMLADVSEAVTHSMKDPSEEEIEKAIATVFKARYDDKQFTESGISEAELEKVKKAFVRVWRTLHHERLKYPSTTTGKMAVAPEQTGESELGDQNK